MPHKPRLFIGSSTEGLEVARAIQFHLQRDAETVLWADNVFAPTDYALESLERELQAADCGVFVLTPDDLVRSRGAQRKSPRDNVVLELGLFAGKLGRRRAVVVQPRGSNLKIPSDWLGINPVDYDHPEDPTKLITATASAATQLRLHLNGLPARPLHVTWDETCALVRKLAGMLRRSPSNGGFSFDVLVGLSRGGVIVADLLSRIYGGNTPVICLWADRHSAYPQTTFAPPDNWVNQYVLSALASERVRNILVVDDITRQGRTLAGAKDFLVSALPDKTVKSAILFAPPEARERIDYVARILDTRQVQTSFALVDD
ncbi:Phosphoribosyl transferase domain-containing protein [Micromonospora viridifaciens]|uniref:Phosphoribosyl transferase domain-containing protein n=1 Tax=Micromonospora viridifaciens TaxID=1881 RepID=A0A1C4U0D8_MICVI|nr:TIR domain-containing protein [Micromonospora viridifaciens]SCE65163.1 Phosphoribosyl transferase domain-containing protein [Micromonospora viridifaciens]